MYSKLKEKPNLQSRLQLHLAPDCGIATLFTSDLAALKNTPLSFTSSFFEMKFPEKVYPKESTCNTQGKLKLKCNNEGALQKKTYKKEQDDPDSLYVNTSLVLTFFPYTLSEDQVIPKSLR